MSNISNEYFKFLSFQKNKRNENRFLTRTVQSNVTFSKRNINAVIESQWPEMCQGIHDHIQRVGNLFRKDGVVLSKRIVFEYKLETVPVSNIHYYYINILIINITKIWVIIRN